MFIIIMLINYNLNAFCFLAFNNLEWAIWLSKRCLNKKVWKGNQAYLFMEHNYFLSRECNQIWKFATVNWISILLCHIGFHLRSFYRYRESNNEYMCDSWTKYQHTHINTRTGESSSMRCSIILAIVLCVICRYLTKSSRGGARPFL